MVVEGIKPVTPSSFNNTDLLLPEEKIMMAYRKHLQTWDRQGWRIDSEKVDRDRTEIAYAVPSPARKTQKAWVLREIPLIAPG